MGEFGKGELYHVRSNSHSTGYFSGIKQDFIRAIIPDQSPPISTNFPMLKSILTQPFSFRRLSRSSKVICQ